MCHHCQFKSYSPETIFIKRTNQCAWCAEVLSARAEQTRWVMESDRFVAFCPRAARLPYETWIMPKQHQSHFELTDLADLADLAKLWVRLFRALEPEIRHILVDSHKSLRQRDVKNIIIGI